MDGKAFIANVEKKLVPISPIMGFAIKKQLAEIGTTAEDLSASEALLFIDKMADAMELFLGQAESVKERNAMMSLFRKHAPEYFEKQSLV